MAALSLLDKSPSYAEFSNGPGPHDMASLPLLYSAQLGLKSRQGETTQQRSHPGDQWLARFLLHSGDSGKLKVGRQNRANGGAARRNRAEFAIGPTPPAAWRPRWTA